MASRRFLEQYKNSAVKPVNALLVTRQQVEAAYFSPIPHSQVKALIQNTPAPKYAAAFHQQLLRSGHFNLTENRITDPSSRRILNNYLHKLTEPKYTHIVKRQIVLRPDDSEQHNGNHYTNTSTGTSKPKRQDLASILANLRRTTRQPTE